MEEYAKKRVEILARLSQAKNEDERTTISQELQNHDEKADAERIAWSSGQGGQNAKALQSAIQSAYASAEEADRKEEAGYQGAIEAPGADGLRRALAERAELQKKLLKAESDRRQKLLGTMGEERKRLEEEFRQMIEAIKAEITSFDNSHNSVAGFSAHKDTASRKTFTNFANELREGSVGWRYSTSKAKGEVAKRALSNAHNYILSEGEQKEVWDGRGIKMLNSALTENIEQLEKKMADMSYNTFVDNVKNALRSSAQARAEGREIDEETRASYMALFKHGINKSWIDDKLIAIWSDPKLKKDAQELLGWNDNDFEDNKINVLQSLFATGMDWNFAANHCTVGRLMDVVVKEMGVSMERFYEGVRTGRFTNNEGTDITGAVESRVGKGVFEKMKAGVAGRKKGILGNRDEFESGYLDVIRKNQAQFQFLTDMREKLVGTTHPENGGHAAQASIGGGERLFVPMGSEIAKMEMLGEENKLPEAMRGKSQTHAMARKLSEQYGVLLALDEDKVGIMRGGITNTTTHSNTTSRYLNHVASLSSTEDESEYKDTEGMLNVVGRNNNTGSVSAFQLACESVYQSEFASVSDPKLRRGLASSYWMNDVASIAMSRNVFDFLMIMAKKSGVNPQEALLTGKMNMKVATRNGKVESIRNVQGLIDLYNSGAFEAGGKPPMRKLANFTPADMKTVKANRKGTEEEESENTEK